MLTRKIETPKIDLGQAIGAMPPKTLFTVNGEVYMKTTGDNQRAVCLDTGDVLNYDPKTVGTLVGHNPLEYWELTTKDEG